MFGAMMDGIKEESVGFLFNLEVQVEEPAPPPEAEAEPQLDEAVLEAAERTRTREVKAPHVSARGLDRDTSARPLLYSAPTLGSETPEVQMSEGDGAGGPSKSAKRQQQSRANPNRGSRGNRSTAARRRKR